MKILLSILFFLFSINSALAEKPLLIVTSSPAGGGVDVALRFFVPHLEEELKRPIVILNMPAQEGLAAAQHFANLPADGNAILLSQSALATIKLKIKNLNFDPLTDFVPVHGFLFLNQLVAVSANSNINDFKDLVELSKSKGSVTGANTGLTSTLITYRLLDINVPMNSEIIRYSKPSQGLIDVSENRVDYVLTPPTSVKPFVDSNKLKVIGVIGDSRNRLFPEVKTLKEQGFDLNLNRWWAAFFMHSNAPDDSKVKIYQAIKKVLFGPIGKEYLQKPEGAELLLIDGLKIKNMLDADYILIENLLSKNLLD